MRDTLQIPVPGGIVCSTGILGGAGGVPDFSPITDIKNGTYLTGFYSNYPHQEDIAAIFDLIRCAHLHPPVGRVFAFGDLPRALVAQDRGEVAGKIVITM